MRLPLPRRPRASAGPAPRRGRLAPLAAALALLAGCAPGLAERYRAAHPGWEPAPAAAGQPAAEVLAALEAPGGEGRSVELRELRVLDLGAEPWRALSAEDVVEGRTRAAGPLGAAAVRRCEARHGLSVTRAERASWYLFDEQGTLRAFDHASFGAGCETALLYRPAPSGPAARAERALASYAGQRARREAPAAPEALLRRGLALLGAGRLEEAAARLRAGERALRRVEAERDRLAEGGTERADATRRLRRARRQLAELERRLERARERREAPPTPDAGGARAATPAEAEGAAQSAVE